MTLIQILLIILTSIVVSLWLLGNDINKIKKYTNKQLLIRFHLRLMSIFLTMMSFTLLF